MRIALIADYYEPYLRSFHARCQPEANHWSYTQWRDKLLDEYFGSFVSYYNHLRKRGHFCELIIGNYYPLQQQWCSENHIQLRAGKSCKMEVAIRQLAAIKPDVVFLGSMFDYYGRFLSEVSKLTKNIFSWIACPHPADLDFSRITCVLSSAPAFVEKFRRRGARSELLKAAFDGDILSKLTGHRKQYDLTFVGSLSEATHKMRLEKLNLLLDQRFPLRIWGCYRHRHRLLAYLGKLFPRKIMRVIQGEAWGLEMYRILADSRISLNIHIDCAYDHHMVGNMRLYEATGCGALLVTDSGPGLDQLFKPGVEVVSYNDSRDLIDQIRFYMNHPVEAAQIAAAGQQACLQRHGYDRRIQEFEAILLKYCQ